MSEVPEIPAPINQMPNRDEMSIFNSIAVSETQSESRWIIPENVDANLAHTTGAFKAEELVPEDQQNTNPTHPK